MRIVLLGGLIASALAVSSCATMNSPEAYANAAATKSQGCKMIAVYSTPQELRTQLDTGVPGTNGIPKTAMAETDGMHGTMQVNANPPPSLQTPLGRLNSTTGRMLQDC